MKRAHGPLKTTPTCSAAHGNYCPWFTLTFASLTKSLCIFQFICQLKKKTTLYITDVTAAWIEVPVSSHGVQFCHPLVSLKLSADAAAPPWETGYHHPAQGLMRDFLTWVMGNIVRHLTLTVCMASSELHQWNGFLNCFSRSEIVYVSQWHFFYYKDPHIC